MALRLIVTLEALPGKRQKEDIALMQSRVPGGKGLQFKSVEAGAATSVYAATAPELEGKGGLYLEDCHIGRERVSEDDVEGYLPWAVDRKATSLA